MSNNSKKQQHEGLQCGRSGGNNGEKSIDEQLFLNTQETKHVLDNRSLFGWKNKVEGERREDFRTSTPPSPPPPPPPPTEEDVVADTGITQVNYILNLSLQWGGGWRGGD